MKEQILEAIDLIEEERINKAVERLKKVDKEIVTHLEQVADLGERNILLFKIGLDFLNKKR